MILVSKKATVLFYWRLCAQHYWLRVNYCTSNVW